MVYFSGLTRFFREMSSTVTNLYHLHMQIRTSDNDSVLLGSNSTSGYIRMELNGGYLRLYYNYEGSSQRETYVSNGIYCADEEWHDVRVRVEDNYAALIVDSYESTIPLSKGLTIFKSNQVKYYVGGGNTIRESEGNTIREGEGNYVQRPYRGCMRDLTINDNPFYSRDEAVQENGMCDAETFFAARFATQNKSSIAFDMTYQQEKPNSIQFYFRAFGADAPEGVTRLLTITSQADDKALLLMNVPSMIAMSTFENRYYPFSKVKAYDGQWHRINVTVDNNQIIMTVDNFTGVMKFIRLNTVKNVRVVLGHLAGVTHNGFNGCLKDVEINNKIQNLNDPSLQRYSITPHGCGLKDACLPYNPCYNGGKCSPDGISYTCSCPDSYDKPNCVDYKYQRSCHDIFMKNPNATSNDYVIDPDGPKMATKPFKVHCRDDDITTTEIAHNQSHNYIKVPSDTSLVGPGKFEVNYTYGYGATFDQLGTLAEQSQNCSQFIGYECQRSVLLNWPKMPYVWWTSRSGTSVFSWGGAPANSSMCDCGLTDTCHGGTGTRCNCDSNSHASLKDEGVIHDRNLLPVKKIHIGYERFTSLTLSFYKLGPFRCGGQAINDVVNLGNQTHIALSDWKDKLDLDISLKFKTVLPEAILMYNDGALSNFFTLSYTPHKILLRYNLNQGNNTVSILQTENYHEGFDDNEWHSVRFRLLYNSAELQVDNLKKVSAEYPIERPLSVFDSQGPIFLGKDPHGNRTFSGCFGNLEISSEKINLQQYVNDVGIENGCDLSPVTVATVNPTVLTPTPQTQLPKSTTKLPTTPTTEQPSITENLVTDTLASTPFATTENDATTEITDFTDDNLFPTNSTEWRTTTTTQKSVPPTFSSRSEISTMFSTDDTSSVNTSSSTLGVDPQTSNVGTYIYIACTAGGLILILAIIILMVVVKQHRRRRSKSRKSRDKKPSKGKSKSKKDMYKSSHSVIYDTNFVTVKVSDRVSFV